jgi:hypothetical protein
MGWCSGSYIAQDLYKYIKKYIPKEHQKKVAIQIFNMFSDADADDWNKDSDLLKDSEIKLGDE